jgi:hypothetical protein
MIKIISIPFCYKNKEYYSLIRFFYKKEHTDLAVTIMNGELEKILSGHNIIQYQCGYLVVDFPMDGSDLSVLKLAIIKSIENYLSVDHHAMQTSSIQSFQQTG